MLNAMGLFRSLMPEIRFRMAGSQKTKPMLHNTNQDPKCGFIFTTNGFVNLLRLQKAAFEKRNWHVSNPHLPILVIAGEEDPVISIKKAI